LPTDTGVSHAVYGSVANTTNGYFRKSGEPRVRAKKWVVNVVPAERLETEVRIGPRNAIDFLKIDVEGAELEALCSSVRWFGRGAVRTLGMELNWETTVQAQARIIEVLLRVLKMKMRDEKLPHIAKPSWKAFYRHEAKMYMGLWEPKQRLEAETSVDLAGMLVAAEALCAQARIMRSAE